jgi:hypothetical protein
MKRLLVALVVIASLCWITFYLYDVNSTKNNFTPEAIFNVDDGQILIVNRPAEIDVAKINGFDQCPSIEVIKKLDGRFYNRAYFSAKRPHMLISGEENWTVEQVKNLFGNDGRVKFDNSMSAFTYLNYSGMIHKRGVYLRDGELQKSQHEKEFNFDKKSSASLISFENENSTVVTDIYYKTLGRFDFITRNAQIKQGKQVNDRELFASYISDQITSYSFHERDYYRTLDSTFTKGPLSNWMDKGFVEIEINGKTALISDYLPGQDPLLILNDLEQEQSNHYKTPLTSKFGLTKNYYIKYLEDMVVLSEDESTCDLIIGEMKLGRTISLNGEKRSLIFGDLPQNVSQRTYRNGDSYSQTVYKGYLLTAKVEKGKASTVSEKNKPLTMAVGDDVIDFKVLNGVGNVVVLTKSNSLVCFNEGKKIWTKKLESLQNKIEVIDLYASGDEYILVSGDDHINLFDIEGKSSSGFPISLESETTAEAKFYRWKNRSYIIVPTVGNKVSLYNGKGGEIRVFNSKIKISQKIDVWASQRLLFYGFKNGEEFVMYDVEKKRTHR